jgi:BMFP domain-containing protein YqiC
MLASFKIDELTKKILETLPIDTQGLEDDIKQKINKILQASLAKLELVNREEFDIQTQVLAKTREKVECLEKKLQELSQQDQTKS